MLHVAIRTYFVHDSFFLFGHTYQVAASFVVIRREQQHAKQQS